MVCCNDRTIVNNALVGRRQHEAAGDEGNGEGEPGGLQEEANDEDLPYGS